jgi:hypothetical protein
MTKKKMIIGATLACVLGCAELMFGQPVVNIGHRHGTLREAQRLIVEAYQTVSQAQENNRYELGGHAAKAKEYLDRADEELRRAADSANDR